jgi:hypothetical protein
MANVPYGEGVPTVTPEVRAPDDYQREQANPEEAGGLIAKGLENLGQGTQRAAANIFDISQFVGKINVDDQVNHWITQHNNILYGDPSKTTIGPDGKPVPDTGYYGLEGRAASDQRDAALKQLEDLRQEGAANLKSPQEKLEYDSQTRRMYADSEQRTGVHADQQWKSWAGNVNATGADLALASIARQPDDLEQFKHNTTDLINFRVKEAQLKYGDDPTITKQTIDEAKAEATAARLQAIAVKDPSKALSLTDNYKNTLSIVDKKTGQSFYDALSTQFRGRAAQQDGITLQRSAMSTTYGNQPPAQPASVTLPQVQGAIRGQESGNRDVVPASITGAVGPNQIEPATFRQYARPGESITNPTDNRAVGDRILADLYQKYGGDPYRVAVAYFSGPNNVSLPGSPTPWINNKADPTGKTVAGYVSDVAARLGVAPGSPYAAEAAAERQIMMSDASDDVKQHALAENARFFREAQIATEGDARAKKDANDKSMNGYVSQIMQTGIATPQIMSQISNDNSLTAETKENLYRFATNDFGFESMTQFGDSYSELYKRILLPAGDPQRINDANQLLVAASPGGGLTPRGADRLMKVFAASRKDPDQTSVNQTKSSLMTYAKNKLSFEEDTGLIKIRDPKGEAIYNASFIPKFESAYDQWIKDGKNPWEFLTRENVDKLANGMRPKAQMDADRMIAQGQSAADVPGQTPQELPATPDKVDPAAWAKVISAAPQSANGHAWPYANWAAVVNKLRENPTPELVKAFDDRFGPAGITAKSVLETLGGGPEKPKETNAPSQEETLSHMQPEAQPTPGLETSLSSREGAGPAGYLGNLIRSVTPQRVQDYVGSR